MLLPGEIAVDNFAGGGGASTGIGMAIGRDVDIAINHDADAIAMHKMNHPSTVHYQEDVWSVDILKATRGRPVGAAWFSPDCKHFSKAKGSTPVSKMVRGLAWITVKWAALTDLRTGYLENVEEFQTWGPTIMCPKKGHLIPDPERKGETFEGFILALTTGLPKTHPAWFDIVSALGAKCTYYKKIEEGLGYDVDYRVLHACEYGIPTIRKRFFMVFRNDGLPIRWPTKTHGTDLLPYSTAADIIDWDIPVRSIFGRKKPLAEKTMIRIARGLNKYVFDTDEPFIIDGESHEVMGTSFITEHANGSSQRNMAIDEPLRTICSAIKGGHFALVTAHLIKFRGGEFGTSADEPVHTISAGGNHMGLVKAFLVEYYGNGNPISIDDPMHTITTKDRFAIIMVKGTKYQIVDVGMRMFEPHELFAAMGFPSEYKISHDENGKKISKAKQIARCGNSVCPDLAKLLVEANL